MVCMSPHLHIHNTYTCVHITHIKVCVHPYPDMYTYHTLHTYPSIHTSMLTNAHITNTYKTNFVVCMHTHTCTHITHTHLGMAYIHPHSHTVTHRNMHSTHTHITYRHTHTQPTYMHAYPHSYIESGNTSQFLLLSRIISGLIMSSTEIIHQKLNRYYVCK